MLSLHVLCTALVVMHQHYQASVHEHRASADAALCRLSNLEVDVSTLASNSSSRHAPWFGNGSRTSTLLVCTMLATAGVTAASMLLAQRFMQGGSRPRTWSRGL